MANESDQIQQVLNLIIKQQKTIDKLIKLVSAIDDNLKALEKVVLKK